jgi:ketosteroid isomerase-like protein
MPPASLPGSARSDAKQISAAFAAALSAGDLDAASACFTRDACLLTPDATAIRGRDQIRPLLRQLIAMRPTARVEQRSMLVAGEVAIATELWTLQIDAAEGTPFAQSSLSTTVLRRIEETWKLQIAAPWGWGTA